MTHIDHKQARIGIAFNDTIDQSIRVIGEATQPLDRLVSPASLWADRMHSLDIRQLVEIPCTLLNPGFGVGAMVCEAGARHGIQFHFLVETNSLTVLRNVVREGLGMTILPFSSTVITAIVVRNSFQRLRP